MEKEELIEIIDDAFSVSQQGVIEIGRHIYLFDKALKKQYDETIKELKDKGYDFVDINEVAKIKPEDYEMTLKDLGYGEEGATTQVKDVKQWTDVQKRRMIINTKLNNLDNKVGEKTILLISYNDLYLEDEMFYDGVNNKLYELIRYWLKDGYCFNGEESSKLLCALVYCETDEKLFDFCRYGDKVKVSEN